MHKTTALRALFRESSSLKWSYARDSRIFQHVRGAPGVAQQLRAWLYGRGPMTERGSPGMAQSQNVVLYGHGPTAICGQLAGVAHLRVADCDDALVQPRRFPPDSAKLICPALED